MDRLDGSGVGCLIDKSESEWDAGDNLVTVRAIGATNGDFSMGATTLVGGQRHPGGG